MNGMNPYEPPSEPVTEPKKYEHSPERPHYIGRFITVLMVAYFIAAFALGLLRH
jgi:hypothetical protein